MNDEDGHFVVRCRSDAALHRAKSLANIEFSWLFAAVMGSCLLMYLVMSRRYGKEAEYVAVEKAGGDYGESEDEQRSFVSMERGMRSNIDLER